MSSPAGTTRFVNLGADVIAEYDGANVRHATYLTTPGGGDLPGMPLAVTTGTTTSYPLLDAVGSVTAFTNSAGSISSSFAYSAYGVPQAASAGTYAYGTHGYDAATGPYYARARYYDPSIGRFLSEDPRYTGSLYGYGLSRPVDRSDPTGQFVLADYSKTLFVVESAANVVLGGF